MNRDYDRGHNLPGILWCERRDSNSHGYPLAPKASASTNSATLAKDMKSGM